MINEEEPQKPPRKRKPKTVAAESEIVPIPEPDLWPDEIPPDLEFPDEVWLEEPPSYAIEAAEDGYVTSEPALLNEPSNDQPQKPVDFPFVPVAYKPETPDETVRQSGLAWSTGVVFFASVAFMLLLGWGADLLFGSSPWGLVLGVVLGSIIGFVQFFRISSQIYAPKKSDTAKSIFDDEIR